MQRRKNVIIIIGVLLLIIFAVLAYSFIGNSKNDSDLKLIKNGNSISYEVTQKDGEYTLINSKNLLTDYSIDFISSKDNQIPLDVSYVATFSVVDNNSNGVKSEINLKLEDTDYGFGSSDDLDKKYGAFVPYNKIKNGAVGVFIFSDNEATVESVKKDPINAKEKVTKDDYLLEQSILTKKK